MRAACVMVAAEDENVKTPACITDDRGIHTGADDEISNSRPPHLGNVRMTVREVRVLVRSVPQTAKPSGKSVRFVQFVYPSTITRSDHPAGWSTPAMAVWGRPTPPSHSLRCARQPLLGHRTRQRPHMHQPVCGDVDDFRNRDRQTSPDDGEVPAPPSYPRSSGPL